jgi:Spy/CpxP family protein refolding chaperone
MKNRETLRKRLRLSTRYPMKIHTTLRFCVFALGLAGAAPLFAQDAPAPAPAPDASAPAPAQDDRRAQMKKMMEKRLQQMKDKLSLTDAQVAQVKDLFKNQFSEMQKIREDDSLSDDDKKAKAKELMKSTREQIRDLLTDDQQKIFDTMPQGPRPHPPGGGDAPPPPPPADAPPTPSSPPPAS